MKKKSLKQIEKERYRKEIIRNERRRILKLVKQARKTSRPLIWLIAKINESSVLSAKEKSNEK